jgi:cytochrome c biogenesis protein
VAQGGVAALERAGFVRAYSDFVNTFGNVLFAVSLFLVWGLLTLIGVVVDQDKDFSTYVASYDAPLARAIVRLGFDNIYHSPWYVGIVALILISLTVCTFKRVIPARLPRLHPVAVEKIPLHATFDADGDEAAVRDRVAATLRKRGWTIREKAFGGVEWTFADKNNWARRGVLIAHLGFVIIAAGTTLYWARGFSGETAVLTGQSVRIPQTGAVLRLDDFAYKIQPILTKSGMVYQPVDYVSHVTAVGNDGRSQALTVRVNHPVDIDKTLYYQASYGFGVRFNVTHNGRPDVDRSSRTLLEGDSIQFPDGRMLIYERFVPTVDRRTGLPAADPRVNDPAAILQAVVDGQPVGEAAVPLRTWIDIGGGWRVTPQRYVLYSGFQYRYDPGVPLVGIGAIVLLIGLIVSFYVLPARLFVRVDPDGPQRSRVGVAATTVKGYDVFEQEFQKLVLALNPG